MKTHLMKTLSLLWLAAGTMPNPVQAAGTNEAALGLVPRPAQLRLQAGNWTLKQTTRIAARGAAAQEANRLADALSASLGRRLRVVSGPARAGDIDMALAASRAELGTEGYSLSVSPQRVVIRAAADAGLFYGGVTLRQLLPPEVFSANRQIRPSGSGCQTFGTGIPPTAH